MTDTPTGVTRGGPPGPFPAAEVGVRQCVPLLGILSMDASLRFYVDGLGFTRTNQWAPEGTILWCWLEHGDAALMLQEYLPAHRPPPSAGKLGLGVSINFTCRDALVFYRALRERGIAAQRPFVGNSMWVTSLEDPDGYSLHFESPTDAPEESEYQDPVP